jgi:hypothetical protein
VKLLANLCLVLDCKKVQASDVTYKLSMEMKFQQLDVGPPSNFLLP